MSVIAFADKTLRKYRNLGHRQKDIPFWIMGKNMGKIFVIICTLGFVLASCTPAVIKVPTITPSPEPTTAQTSTLESTIAETPTLPETNIPISITPADFTEPDPATWVMLMKPVREYFYYRKMAIINANVQILWDHYPELKQGFDRSEGINIESFMVDMYQGMKPFDGNIYPEFYDKIKVIMGNGTAEVLVHGMELYTYKDNTGQFDDSGGELKIILVLSSPDDQNWTVVKTVDITGP